MAVEGDNLFPGLTATPVPSPVPTEKDSEVDEEVDSDPGHRRRRRGLGGQDYEDYDPAYNDYQEPLANADARYPRQEDQMNLIREYKDLLTTVRNSRVDLDKSHQQLFDAMEEINRLKEEVNRRSPPREPAVNKAYSKLREINMTETTEVGMRTWFKRFEDSIVSCHHSEQEKLVLLKSKIDDRSYETVADLLEVRQNLTYSAAKNALLHRFGENMSTYAEFSRFLEMTEPRGVSHLTYMEDLRHQASKAGLLKSSIPQDGNSFLTCSNCIKFQKDMSDITSKLLVGKFVATLHSSRSRTKAHEFVMSSETEGKFVLPEYFAERMFKWERNNVPTHNPLACANEVKEISKPAEIQRVELGASEEPPCNRLSELHKEINAVLKTWPMPNLQKPAENKLVTEAVSIPQTNTTERQVPRGKCYSCGQRGHFRQTCRFRNATCENCGKVGHKSITCLVGHVNQQPDSKTKQQTTEITQMPQVWQNHMKFLEQLQSALKTELPSPGNVTRLAKESQASN